MILATVTSEYTNSERKLDSELTVEKLREKLETVTGIPPSAQTWHISLPSGNAINASLEADMPLAKYIPKGTSSVLLHVQDSRPARDQFSIDESVEKYEMSEVKYEQRKDSVLEWKKQNKLGRFSLEAQDFEKESVQVAVGDRTVVTLKSGGAPYGTVKFIGRVAEIPGDHLWIGVALDSPDGKNDGTVKGTRYFDCAPHHGVFVRQAALTDIVDQSDDEI